MTWQNVEGNWRQFVGEVKQRWGKMTNSDHKEIEGKRDKLIGSLQSMYGMTPDQAGEEVAHIEQRLTESRKGAERMYGSA